MGTLGENVLRNSISDALRCLACGSSLWFDAGDRLRCRACGKTWPVREGIPRFFEPSYYWGEVTKDEAGDLLQQASQLGWRDAVLSRFSNDHDMQISLTDWQRASWLPLLGLDKHSVALDVGCGYGAITHSLARAAGQVFSLEAIPERIDFTRIRLSQEGFCNVQLVQASALDPPFADEMFDLIIVNGVLEWVGEWDHEGDPRSVQVGFLQRLGRILKPNGTLLIGIENRFSYNGALGAIDHSGLPYTNLMPRRVANWWLRRATHAHYRTERNPKREYRTYTYGARGYRKLLANSGIPLSTIYWADPDYNQPYSLIPLSDNLIADRVDTQLSEPSTPLRYGLAQVAKRILAHSGALSFVVPNFVILANKAPVPERARFWQALRARIPELPDVRAPQFSFSSNPFGLKNVIRVFEEGAREPACIIKSTTLAPNSSAACDREYEYLHIVNERFSARTDPCFSVPRPFGQIQLGSFTYQSESVAPGLSLSRAAYPATGRRRFEILRKVLPQCIRATVQITQTLAPEDRAECVDPSWLNPPAEVAGDPKALAELRDLIARCPSDSVQHGDFTVENVLLDSAGTLSVIDWEHLFRGGSPLHDLFTLFISMILGDSVAAGKDETSMLNQFENTFFARSMWTDVIRESVLEVCQALAVPERETGPMLVHCLLLRFNQFKSRKQSLLAKNHAAFLATAVRKSGQFLMCP
jgi:SAM-dependent methyltransferase/uncharacterized protein YbaR (Trm112 family)